MTLTTAEPVLKGHPSGDVAVLEGPRERGLYKVQPIRCITRHAISMGAQDHTLMVRIVRF